MSSNSLETLTRLMLTFYFSTGFKIILLLMRPILNTFITMSVHSSEFRTTTSNFQISVINWCLGYLLGDVEGNSFWGIAIPSYFQTRIGDVTSLDYYCFTAAGLSTLDWRHSFCTLVSLYSITFRQRPGGGYGRFLHQDNDPLGHWN
jgi:hypothetical protein